jgi:hypothetical protein
LNGTVWKAVLHCKKAGIPIYVVDIDDGCGIITPNGNSLPPEIDPEIDKLTYADLAQNRASWLFLTEYKPQCLDGGILIEVRSLISQSVKYLLKSRASFETSVN